MLRPFIVTLTIVLLASPALFAQPRAKKDEPYDQLAKAFKPMVISAIPATLYERNDNWGHQVLVPVGLKWRGLRAEVQKSPRNHAEWRKTIISARDLPKTFDVRIFDVTTVNPETQTFKVLLTFQMGVYYEQQNWESGIRLWSGSIRARARVFVGMECENTLRVELDKNNLPDFILRLRVTQAKVHYDDLVFEHINGIGGDGAKVIGRLTHEAMNRARPGLERDLLAKTSAAIVKAADTREIRVGFGGLIKSK